MGAVSRRPRRTTPRGRATAGAAPYGDDMTDETPERIDASITPDEVDGTPEGNPIAGVQIDEADKDKAVEPDDNAFEVDGPQVGHA